MSEATLVAMLGARMAAIGRAREKCTDPEADMDSISICSRMVAYCSDQVSATNHFLNIQFYYYYCFFMCRPTLSKVLAKYMTKAKKRVLSLTLL